MKTHMLSLAVLALGLAACTITTTNDDDDAGTGGTGGSSGTGGSTGGTGGTEDAGTDSSESCVEEGTGTLSITVTGLPADALPDIAIEGPDYEETVNEDVSFEGDGGTYTLTPADVAFGDEELIRTSYYAEEQSVCVSDGEESSVTVDYDAVGTSGKLWIGTESNLLAFDADSLGDSGSVSAVLDPNVGAVGGLAFDREGGLWATLDGTSLVHWASSELADDATPTSDIIITSDELEDSAGSIALDEDGNVWVAVADEGVVLGFDADDITASGDPSPLTLEGMLQPSSLAFDSDGNLWVADMDADRIYAFDESFLETGAEPEQTIACLTAKLDTIVEPDAMAFDTTDALWIHFAGGEVVRLLAEDRDGSGAYAVTPSLQFTLATATAGSSLAFDEAGGLWLGYGEETIARLSASQLISSDDAVVPYRILTHTSVVGGAGLALFPAPAGLPIYSALP